MPSIGPMELIVVLVIALVFLGPKKLPDMGRSVGRGMREFKSAISGDEESPATRLDPGEPVHAGVSAERARDGAA